MQNTYKFVIFILIIVTLFIAQFAFAWKLVIRGNLNEMYDDNITSATNKREKKYDFITNIVAGLGVNHEGKTQTIDLIANVYQQIYIKNHKLNYNSQDVNLTYRREISERNVFQLNNIFSHYPDAREFDMMFGRTSGRIGYYSNMLHVTDSIYFSRQLIFNLSYRNEYVHFFGENVRNRYVYNYFRGNFLITDSLITSYAIDRYRNPELRETMAHKPGIQIDYHWNSENIFYLIYNFSRTEYTPGAIAYLHSPGLGYRHNFTQQLYFDGRGHAEYIDYKNKKYLRPYIMASLIDDIDRISRISIIFTKQYTLRTDSADIFSNWRISAEFTRQFLARFVFSVSGFYGQGEYISMNTKNSFIGFNTYFNYNLTDHITTYVRYNFTKSDTDINGWNSSGYVKSSRGYIRNIVQLGLRAEY